MNVEPIHIDSQVLGRCVLSLQELNPSLPFKDFETAYLKEHDPGYVYCKVPLERMPDVHFLESQGFNLIECQIKFSVKLLKPYDLNPFQGYIYEPVEREEDLEVVLGIAAETFTHDRWRVDPLLAPRLAGERYKAYVRNSFIDNKERLFLLRDKRSRSPVAFRTHRMISDKEVLFLLGGVDPRFKNMGLGLISEFNEFNELISQGCQKGTTHISAANYPIFNLDMNRSGFRVVTTFAVMRKLYTYGA